MRLYAHELLFAARLQEYIDRARAKWEAEDARKGRPPTKRELDNRWLWEAMIEDTEWENFHGV
jgi:hypothetical protein